MLKDEIAGAWARAATGPTGTSAADRWAELDPAWAGVDLLSLPRTILSKRILNVDGIYRGLLRAHQDHADPLAVLTLLRLLEPGLVSQMRFLIAETAGGGAEIDSTVYTTALEVLATFDSAHRRGRLLVMGLLMEVHRRIVRGLRSQHHRATATAEILVDHFDDAWGAEDTAAPTSHAELAAVLDDAHHRQVITAAERQLLLDRCSLGWPFATRLAATAGLPAATVRQRHSRAVRKLQAAVSAGHLAAAA